MQVDILYSYDDCGMMYTHRDILLDSFHIAGNIMKNILSTLRGKRHIKTPKDAKKNNDEDDDEHEEERNAQNDILDEWKMTDRDMENADDYCRLMSWWSTPTPQPFKNATQMNTSKYIAMAYGPLQIIAGTLIKKKARDVIQKVCEIVRLICRRVIDVRNKQQDLDRTQQLLEALQLELPERNHIIMYHLSYHVVEQQFVWGPVDMRLFERGQHVVKENTCSHVYPEASLANRYTHHVGTSYQTKHLLPLNQALVSGKYKMQPVVTILHPVVTNCTFQLQIAHCSYKLQQYVQLMMQPSHPSL